MKNLFAIAAILLSTYALADNHWSYALSPSSRKVLGKWLSSHTNYRQADVADCDCSEDVEQMKRGYDENWKAIPNYHPYHLEADLNSDGSTDVAVVLIDKSKTVDNFALAVFNGPFVKLKVQEPSFFEAGQNMRHQGLFFGPPRPKPYRLVLGAFESEGGVLEPKGPTYVWASDDN